MNIFLDDMREAKQIFGGEGKEWLIARDIEVVKPLLERGLVEHLSLDNDMGPGRQEGYKLVDWMIETGHWPTITCVAHSMNPIARQRMTQDLIKHFNPKQ